MMECMDTAGVRKMTVVLRVLGQKASIRYEEMVVWVLGMKMSEEFALKGDGWCIVTDIHD